MGSKGSAHCRHFPPGPTVQRGSHCHGQSGSLGQRETRKGRGRPWRTNPPLPLAAGGPRPLPNLLLLSQLPLLLHALVLEPDLDLLSFKATLAEAGAAIEGTPLPSLVCCFAGEAVAGGLGGHQSQRNGGGRSGTRQPYVQPSGATWYLGDPAPAPPGLSLPTLHSMLSLPMLLLNEIPFLWTCFCSLLFLLFSLSLCIFISYFSSLLLLSAPPSLFLPIFFPSFTFSSFIFLSFRLSYISLFYFILHFSLLFLPFSLTF